MCVCVEYFLRIQQKCSYDGCKDDSINFFKYFEECNI